ncbi:hypothetical protein HN604_02650 [archaeon]|jgi:hypothetical protein|nr:hypothetical protein [archaeon]MBT6182558.1 hypothetical protein [archaeon]MBT6606069.1 hypothetical protein [archaeon]MBT7252091.1 hypothetical protein [archaeon]MBT7660960.1 hypothetical protein [archaeon]
MVCKKCDYISNEESKVFGTTLCSICKHFAPEKINDFQNYLLEKIDWKSLDTFRKYDQKPGQKQKQGMRKQAQIGKIVTRPPLGYKISNKNLIQDENASKVHNLFSTFLKEDESLNQLSKKFQISINGIKKILTNRTYLGEIKFDNLIYKSNHKNIISQETFYAVQRKLKTYLRPRN